MSDAYIGLPFDENIEITIIPACGYLFFIHRQVF
jgi:hypothetical protein